MDKKKGIKIRGTATYYEDDHSFEFQSQKEGQPQRKNVKKFGLASSYETTGKEPKKVLTLQCPVSTVDAKAELVNQFNSFLREEFKSEKSEELKLDGIKIVDSPDLKMSLDTKEGVLGCTFKLSLSPTGNLDYKNKFYQLIQEISKFFTINEKTIAHYSIEANRTKTSTRSKVKK